MNKLTRILFALWIVAAGIAGSPQPCIADTDTDTPVTLRSQTEVHRMNVKLSDVFNGIDPDNDHDIAQSPAPGKRVSYDINVLTRLAQKYKLAWKSQSLADHVVISTVCSRITSDMIRDAVATKIKDLSVTSAKNSIDVAFDNHNMQLDFPDEHVPEFTLNNFDYDTAGRHFRADLVTTSASGVFSMPITGRVVIKRSVPILTRRLEGGTVIGAADLDTVLIAEDHANGAVVTEPEQLIGRELRHDTAGGEILHMQDVIPPRYVTRGSIVTIKIETPFMSISAQGKAMQDGAKGDAIRVTNTQSNRVVEGTVDGPGSVRVDVTQKVAAAQ